MVQTMTPSTTVVTAGQIGKIQELLGAALRKSGLPSEPTQKVLETQGESLAAALVAEVRKRVEAVSDLIVRRVKVDRSRTPVQALKATGRVQYVTDSVVAEMPRGDSEEAEVCFFKLGRYVSDADLENEYDLLGLKPADVYSLVAVNEADPKFADDHPNGTHWQDSEGKWCFAAFRRWLGERYVVVVRRGSDWSGSWWFAGLRK